MSENKCLYRVVLLEEINTKRYAMYLSLGVAGDHEDKASDYKIIGTKDTNCLTEALDLMTMHNQFLNFQFLF